LLYSSYHKDKYLDAELSIVVMSTMTQHAVERDGQSDRRNRAKTPSLSNWIMSPLPIQRKRETQETYVCRQTRLYRA